MDYIRKIPTLLGVGAALLIGIIGYASGVPNRDNTVNIIMGMAIFYITGIFIRSAIKNIIEQTLVKIKKKEEEEKNRLKLKEEEEKQQSKQESERRKAGQIGSKVDLVADDKAGPITGDEDFDALPVADFIKNELK